MWLCCTLGGACCKCLCLPAKALGVAQNNYAKLGYVFFQFFWVLISIIVVYCSQSMDGFLAKLIGLDCEEEDATMACYGGSTFARLSFSLLCFHLLMLLIIMCRNKAVADFHDGCWCFKLVLFAALFFVSFYIPNDPFFTSFYMNMACVFSLGFLGFQALYILICALLINENLFNNIEKEGMSICTCSGIIWLIFFLLITGANITWLVFMWINFGSVDGCSTSLAVMTITTIAAVVMQIITCFGLRKDASELTSAIVILYCLFLQWSALSSYPDAECNPYDDSSGNAVARLVINLVITFITMFTAAATVDDDAPVAEAESSSEQLNEALLPAETSKNNEGAKTAEDGDATSAAKTSTINVVNEEQGVSFAISTPTLWFQLLFSFASIYYCMLLTSWGSPDSLDEGTKLFGDTSSKLCFWI